MTDPSENYVPQEITSRYRRQAIRVWTIGLFVVMVWVLLILAAPLAKANGFEVQ